MASSARIDELRKKFEENPRRYFAPLANEYRKAGDIEQAISICREYLPQQPGHMSGHIVFGQALYEARQYEEARTVFETALALDPENLIALRHLGDIALIVGNIDGARTWYGRVLDADPRNEEIQAQLKSLESVAPAAAPTPMSSPSVAPLPAKSPFAPPEPANAPSTPAEPASAASPDAGPLPSLELTMPTGLTEPPRTPASSAPTVVVPAMPTPAVPRTVEIPATPPSAPVQSLSTAPTAEITLDQVPVPAVPDLEKAAESPSAELPVEKATGFEPTAAAMAQNPPQAQAAGLETTASPPSEPSLIESLTLDGLETTSMAEPATSADAPSSAPVPDLHVSPRPAVEASAHAKPDRESAAGREPAVAEEPSAANEPAPVSEPVPVNEATAVTDEPAVAVEPPAPSAELPFIDMGTTTTPSPTSSEPSPEPAAEPAMVESKPFVTETMAELYEQQGHRDEALRVYRALLDQRPGDEHIRTRIEQLEGKRGPTIRELLSRVAARRPTVTAPSAPDPQVEPTAEAPPALINAPTASPEQPGVPEAPVPTASVDAPPPPPAAAEPDEAPRSRTDLLGRLFGSAPVAGADENAALTLAAAFSNDGRANGSGASPQQLPGAPAHPASKDLSLDAVFGSERPGTPPASSFSFDQFFSERATAEHPAPGARSAAEGQETRDDVAKFTQWLEGLKQR